LWCQADATDAGYLCGVAFFDGDLVTGFQREVGGAGGRCHVGYPHNRLQRTMTRRSSIFGTIQSESIVPNLLKIQKFDELSDAELAELIGVSKRVWSLAKSSGTALNSATMERIVELFPEAIPILFHENANKSFGRIVKKLDKTLEAKDELEQHAFRLLSKGKRSRQTQ